MTRRTSKQMQLKVLSYEYVRIAATIRQLNLMPDTWQPPLLTLMGLRRRDIVGGTYRCYPGTGARVIIIRFGPYTGLGRIYQTIAHELAHDVTVSIEGLADDEDAAHGLTFRRTLRTIVRSHWPGVSKWCERNAPGKDVCYAEDRDMERAIQRLYPHVGPQPLKLR